MYVYSKNVDDFMTETREVVSTTNCDTNNYGQCKTNAKRCVDPSRLISIVVSPKYLKKWSQDNRYNENHCQQHK